MGAGLVMLREGFEASLIVGILLAFLNRTDRRDGFRAVWLGAGLATVISIAVGAGLFAVGAELKGTAEVAFEGGAMLIAAGLLTWMIFWMRKQSRGLKRELEAQVEHALASGSAFALGLVAFISVLREGVETAHDQLEQVERERDPERVPAHRRQVVPEDLDGVDEGAHPAPPG